MRFLKNHRARPIYPTRVLPPIAALLDQLAELADGIARELDDPRWAEAATAIAAAATWIRSPYSHRHAEEVHFDRRVGDRRAEDRDTKPDNIDPEATAPIRPPRR